MNIYETCPTLENDHFLLRFVKEEDCDDLLEVYSDKKALPFFNSDNCHGDNFYYPAKEKMMDAILFWKSSYENKWFVRWTIVDKSTSKAIGTIELCYRVSDDAFNHAVILRLDVKSDYEKEAILLTLVSLITPPAFEWFESSELITKAPIYAIERINAIQQFGFRKSEDLLIGANDRYAYNGYWTVKHK